MLFLNLGSHINVAARWGMDKILEDYLWNEIHTMNNHSFIPKRVPRDVINEMLDRGWISSPKQAWRTLEKWLKKRKYDYGCALDCGWKIEKIDSNQVNKL